MEMNVRDHLSPVLSYIKYYFITVLNFKFFRGFFAGKDHFAEKLNILFVCLVNCRNMFFGNYKIMYRGLGHYVGEHGQVIVFEHELGVRFTAYYLAKNILIAIHKYYLLRNRLATSFINLS